MEIDYYIHYLSILKQLWGYKESDSVNMARIVNFAHIIDKISIIYADFTIFV